jgi:arylsulfatase
MSGNESFYYSTWCTGEREFYDMNTDIVQMNNRLGSNSKGGLTEYYGRPWKEVIARLDSLLMVTKSCKQDSCRDPWGVLFPKGQVTDLETAMRPEYDTFFSNQPKVEFTACQNGYIVADEGPQNVLAFR